jgi:hypothetical protein
MIAVLDWSRVRMLDANTKVFVAGIVGVAAIIAVLFAPDQAILILGFAATTIAALLAYVQARETHMQVNSRMDQLLEAATGKATAEATLASDARHAGEPTFPADDHPPTDGERYEGTGKGGGRR